MLPSARFLPTFPEEWLRRTWGHPRLLRDPLRTVDGRAVRVLSPGVPNAGDGPDILNATLMLDETPLRGDIEFHFRTGDWYAHRHHIDARYRRVVLHVVLAHTHRGFYVRRADNFPIPILELRTSLQVPIGRLAPELVQISERPECPLPSDLPPLPVRHAVLSGLAETRLLRKAERFRDRLLVVGENGAFYEMLADALGYSQNRLPFAKLVDRLPLTALLTMPPTEMEAYLLGTAGFLPSQRKGERKRGMRNAECGTGYVRMVEDLWGGFAKKPEPLRFEEWHVSPVRVGNMPLRRVVALARLVARTTGDFLGEIVRLAREGDVNAWRRRWKAFQVATDNYWAHHNDFGKPANSPAHWLVGEMRARDIWVNVALPALIVISEMLQDSCLRARAVALYRAHPPLQPNLKSEWVSEHVLRCEPDTTRQHPAHLQQGMLELYDHFCEPRRCGECPLACHLEG